MIPSGDDLIAADAMIPSDDDVLQSDDAVLPFELELCTFSLSRVGSGLTRLSFPFPRHFFIGIPTVSSKFLSCSFQLSCFKSASSFSSSG